MKFKPAPYESHVLDQIVKTAKQEAKRRTPDNPYVIGVSGGSCTGKTTYVSKRILNELKDDVLVIPQDEYQLGYDLPDYKQSKYRWDDPANYDPTRLVKDVQQLKKGQRVSLPKFDLPANVRVSEHPIEPKPVILLEGLYTFHDVLLPEVDMKIYVETPYYGRFLRRVLRNTLHYGMDPDIPIKHMLGSVYMAHQDHVSQQRPNADYLISIPYVFEETIRNFNLKPIPEDPMQIEILTLPLERHLSLRVVTAKGKTYLQILSNGVIYYQVETKEEYIDFIRTLDFQTV